MNNYARQLSNALADTFSQDESFDQEAFDKLLDKALKYLGGVDFRTADRETLVFFEFVESLEDPDVLTAKMEATRQRAIERFRISRLN